MNFSLLETIAQASKGKVVLYATTRPNLSMRMLRDVATSRGHIPELNWTRHEIGIADGRVIVRDPADIPAGAKISFVWLDEKGDLTESHNATPQQHETATDAQNSTETGDNDA